MKRNGCLSLVFLLAMLLPVLFTNINIAAAGAEVCPDCRQAADQSETLIPQNPIFAVQDAETPLPEKEICILVDTPRRVLTVLANGEPQQQFPVAVGKYETPTPIGSFQVLRKAKNWGTGFGSRWLGLTVPWGIYGIHGTNKPYSIGGFASHGCIRMHNQQVEKIYPMVPLGSRVIIVGNAFQYQDNNFRPLRRDDRGSDVLEIQMRLKRLGYYDGPLDGIWGGGMESAVLSFRQSKELSPDNTVDAAFYRCLGL